MTKQEGAGRSRWLSHLGRLLLVSIVLSLGFAWGALSFRQQTFPYTLIRDTIRSFSPPAEADARSGVRGAEIARLKAYSLGELGSSERIVETLLLPIALKAVELTQIEGFASAREKRGGLCSVDGKIVVSDNERNFAFVDLVSGEVSTLRSVMLPLGEDPVESTKLVRVHDVECSDRAGPPRVLVSYEIGHGPEFSFQNLVATIGLEELMAGDSDAWRVVFTSQPGALHWGGRLVFVDDRSFAVSVSSESDHAPDVDLHPEQVAEGELPVHMDRSSHQGKIFTVDLETAEATIFSLGHRNTQGLARDRQGRLFNTEHGPNGGDEFNWVERDGNYGWPRVSHGINYQSYTGDSGAPGRHDGYAKPVFSWNPSIGISNLIQVRDFAEQWNGDFLISSLKANSLFRVRLHGRALEFAEQIWLGERIRDLTNTGDGRIALFTDSGKLILLEVSRALLATAPTTFLDINNRMLMPCLTCHHFGPTNPTLMAPTLSRVVGREIASDGFSYTPGLAALTGTWSRERLREFLSNPSSVAPGTTMTYAVADEGALEELLDHLERINDVGARF